MPVPSASRRAAWSFENFLKSEVMVANFSSACGLSCSSIWASDRAFSSSSSSRLRLGAALDHVLVVFVGPGLGLVGDLFLFLDGRAGGLLADLALGAAFFAAFLARGDLLGGRALRQHGFEIDDLAQLHAAFVEGVRPVDDGVEGHGAFAKAPDHDVAAGLDALGDGDLALAGEQLHRAHLAQVHADGVVGAVDGFLLGRRGRAGAAVVEGIDLLLGGLVLFLFVVVRGFLVLDDVDAHFGDRGHDVLDLLRRHLVLGKGLVELIDR